MEQIKTVLQSIYTVCLESGWFVILGIAVAGLVHVFLKAETLTRHLGQRSLGSVLRAAAIGIPLPLCSCSVIPVASGLKKKGADDSAVASFLISTPENGVDSIALSWSLLGPWLTVFRVVASFFTALMAGIGVLLWGKPIEEEPKEEAASCCSTKKTSCCGEEKPKPPSFLQRVWSGQHYAFGDLFVKLSLYFLWGLIATGVIAAFVPQSFLEQHANGGIGSMLMMLVIGIPIYVCASGSTPLVAGLIAMGMSPGTALVFLLAGPATNVATMAVVRGMMGMRGLIIYLGSIAVCSVGFGLIVDLLASSIAMGRPDLFHAHEHGASLFAHIGAIIFIGLVLWGVFVLKVKPLLAKKPKEGSCCGG